MYELFVIKCANSRGAQLAQNEELTTHEPRARYRDYLVK